jgi:hypothetical protein
MKELYDIRSDGQEKGGGCDKGGCRTKSCPPKSYFFIKSMIRFFPGSPVLTAKYFSTA